MAYGFGPIVPPAVYSGQTFGATNQAAIFGLPDCSRLDIWVNGNPIYYQLFSSRDSDQYELPERYIPANPNLIVFVSLDRLFSGIQVRLADPALSSLVVVECYQDWELS